MSLLESGCHHVLRGNVRDGSFSMIKGFIIKKIATVAGKRLLGFALGSWFKAAIAAGVVATFTFLVFEYNKGQKALVEVQQLNTELLEQQETFKAELAASEQENENLKERHKQELSLVISNFEEEIERNEETEQNIIDLKEIDGADDEAPEFFQEFFK